jgi:riboflavin synthase
MFTGIITDIGVIRAVQKNGDTRFEVTTKYNTASIDIGASIACAGTCLTVIETGANWFAAQVSAETLSKTTLGSWQNEVSINLERALRVGDELSGHVDGVGDVSAISADGDSIRATIKPPLDLMTAISSKGSVTIDGVSLTVNAVTDQEFGVNLIPHTQQFTTLGGIKEGQRVNLEIDQLARYVARALGKE